ncbi:uncharacterized protein LOC131888427 [Tigriopus californicus]|uniref:uncharacterized protein LOC131888427 n=1 Tax=Tigriopus californicus TaxID=6832 RepID=UPI0027DA67FA|nr:uncharacterized protein LOC131888427 [Tigriopus californicus]
MMMTPQRTHGRISLKMSPINNSVSVLCSEKGGKFCPRCVGLEPALNCGWCHVIEGCTTRSQCLDGPWLPSGSVCPYETIVGIFLLSATLIAIVILITLFLLMALLTNYFVKNNLKNIPPSKYEPRLKGIAPTPTLPQPFPAADCQSNLEPIYAAINKHRRRHGDGIHPPLPPTPASSSVTYGKTRARLSKVSFMDIVWQDNGVMTRSLTSEECTSRANSNSVTRAPPSMASASMPSEPTPMSGTTYLAESPFSCQTSIVPMTRNQFYLVVQINMNGGNQDVGSDSSASTTTNLTTQAEEEEEEPEVQGEEGFLSMPPRDDLEERLSLSELGIVNQGRCNTKEAELDPNTSDDSSDHGDGTISSSLSSTSLASSLQTVILAPSYSLKNEKA